MPEYGPSPHELTVFYDGDCSLCTRVVCQRSQIKKSFNIKNIRTDQLPEDIPFADAERELIVRDAKGNTYRNIDAVFLLLQQNRLVSFLAAAARIPCIHRLFEKGYRWVAHNRSFLIGAAAPLYWIKWIVGLSFLACMALSLRLWIDDRIYPTVPVFSFFPKLPLVTNVALLLGVAATIFCALLSAKPQNWLKTTAVILVLLGLFDQSRWQPWVIDYLLLFVIFSHVSWNAKDKAGYEKCLRLITLLFAGIYLFSGLQKLNTFFLQETFPWFIRPLAHVFPKLEGFLTRTALAIPLIESAIGVGLLTRRFRRLALFSAAAMHAFIFWMIGPWGWNWNQVVWPWTIAFCLTALMLAQKPSNASLKELLLPTWGWLQRVILLVVFLLPGFSFVNLWDSYLSHALYSGNLTQTLFILPHEARGDFPTEVAEHIHPYQKGFSSLDLNDWSQASLGVPVYPETRIIKKISAFLCQKIPQKDAYVLIEERRAWRNHATEHVPCESLVKIRSISY